MATDPSSTSPPSLAGFTLEGLLERHAMAVDKVTQRLVRITQAFRDAGVPYAVVGGQAVAMWVATRDPDAVRTTKDVDILLNRADLPRARAAARTAGMDYFEVMNVGMFIEKEDPNPKKAVHIVWAGEYVMQGCPFPSPATDERETLPSGYNVVKLSDLLKMKLMANRDHDRAHIRDLIDVGLIGPEMLADLPEVLADRLRPFLEEQGR